MTESKKKAKGLGRGLDALFGESISEHILDNEQVIEMAINLLQAGKYQPRTVMHQEGLEELAESIRNEGILSPLIVRQLTDGKYEIIAGERRFRAAQLAGLKTVPVLIRSMDDLRALALALIENIQREDLNPIEEAVGIARLIEEFHYTHEQAAQAVGRSRSATSNLLRLLTLTQEVRELVLQKKIEMGHARALISLPEEKQIEIANEVVERNLSVRQTEALVKKQTEAKTAKKTKVIIRTKGNESLEKVLTQSLGTVVKLSANKKGKGKLVIEFGDLEQLDGIVQQLHKDTLL